MLLFTSGTSAAPKAAVLRHDQLLAYVFNTLEFGSAGEDEAAIVSVPPFHIAGVAAVLSSTYIGRRIVPLPQFSAEEWIATAKRERVTHATVVPTMLARIVQVMEGDPDARVPTLRNLAYGGARMHTSVLERALHLMPATDFVNAYGLTETSSTVALLGPDDHRLALYSDEPLFENRLASVGRPVPGIEIRIIDPDGAEVDDRHRRRDPHPRRPGQRRLRRHRLEGRHRPVAAHRRPRLGRHRGLPVLRRPRRRHHHPRRREHRPRRSRRRAPPTRRHLHRRGRRPPRRGMGRSHRGHDHVAARRRHHRHRPRPRLGPHPPRLLKTPETIHIVEELPQTATGKILRRQVRDDLIALYG